MLLICTWGHVRKNETLGDAFVRLLREELGIGSGITRSDAKFLGVFDIYMRIVCLMHWLALIMWY